MRKLIIKTHRGRAFLIAATEVAFIIFLFYSNLLMGEFNASNDKGKTLLFALRDIFTYKNLAIAIAASVLGHAVFEFLRGRVRATRPGRRE
jgi:hypothetical protein